MPNYSYMGVKCRKISRKISKQFRKRGEWVKAINRLQHTVFNPSGRGVREAVGLPSKVGDVKDSMEERDPLMLSKRQRSRMGVDIPENLEYEFLIDWIIHVHIIKAGSRVGDSLCAISMLVKSLQISLNYNKF